MSLWTMMLMTASAVCWLSNSISTVRPWKLVPSEQKGWWGGGGGSTVRRGQYDGAMEVGDIG